MTDRPPRPPAPPLPAFDQLDAAHAKILQELDQFDSLLAHVATEGLDAKARRWAASIDRFFKGEAHQHHVDEERIVFPGLLSHGNSRIVHEVQRLQQDHRWLEEDWRVLQPQVEAIAEGIGGVDMEMLTRAVPVFSKLYREHIALEESMIYPAARRLQGQTPQS